MNVLNNIIMLVSQLNNRSLKVNSQLPFKLKSELLLTSLGSLIRASPMAALVQEDDDSAVWSNFSTDYQVSILHRSLIQEPYLIEYMYVNSVRPTWLSGQVKANFEILWAGRGHLSFHWFSTKRGRVSGRPKWLGFGAHWKFLQKCH